MTVDAVNSKTLLMGALDDESLQELVPSRRNLIFGPPHLDPRWMPHPPHPSTWHEMSSDDVMSPDGRLVARSNDDEAVWLDTIDGVLFAELQPKAEDEQMQTPFLVFSPDGTQLIFLYRGIDLSLGLKHFGNIPSRIGRTRV